MWIASVACAFAASILGHAALCRTRLPGSTVLKFLVSGGVCGSLLLGALLEVHGASVATISAALVYALACEIYIFAFTATLSSVSISLLRTLRAVELSPSEIEARYSVSSMIRRRLGDMVSVGLLSHDGHAFTVTARGAQLLKSFEGLRRAFRLRPLQ